MRGRDNPAGMAQAMRCLIGALRAMSLLAGVDSRVAAAATVSCGRVTTFVNPDSSGALNNGDGWLIVAKLDGTSEKVILRSRSQTSFGGISGYICMNVDGMYFAGLLTPGAAGYIPEPADFVTGTGVYCGTVAANPYSSGQMSGPRTLQLHGGLSAYGDGIFSVPVSIPLPAVGTYFCGRFSVGGPSQLVTALQPGDPGYVAAGLPNSSTAPARGVPLIELIRFALVTGLGVLMPRTRRT